MNVSYAITVCDELNELKRLVRILLGHINGQDEIVIQYDEPKSPAALLEYLAFTKRWPKPRDAQSASASTGDASSAGRSMRPTPRMMSADSSSPNANTAIASA